MASTNVRHDGEASAAFSMDDDDNLSWSSEEQLRRARRRSGSDSSSTGPPPLIHPNDDSSDTSSDGPPPLIPRHDGDSSDDDDDDDEQEGPFIRGNQQASSLQRRIVNYPDELTERIATQSVEAVHQVLQQAAAPHVPPPHETHLVAALERGDEDILRVVLQAVPSSGEEVQAATQHQFCPRQPHRFCNNNMLPALFYAASQGNSEMVELLLQHQHADIHATIDGGCTILHHLICNFICGDDENDDNDDEKNDSSDDQDEEDNDDDAEIALADMMVLLLKRGADPSKANENLQTPLHLAITNRLGRVARLLIQYEADPDCLDAQKQTPLHIACNLGDKETAQWLVRHVGANPRLDYDGCVPIFHCLDFVDKPTPSRLMLELGVDPYQINAVGNTALHVLVAKKQVDALEFVDELCVFEPHLVNMTDAQDRTPLFFVETPSMANALLYHGADASLMDCFGSTPLIHAIVHDRDDVAECLISRGHPIVWNAARNDGFTALHLSCLGNKQNLVRLLLEGGANVNSRSQSGLSPLHLANFPKGYSIQMVQDVDVSHLLGQQVPVVPVVETLDVSACVDLLLQYKASASAADRQGNLPFCLATRTGRLADILVMLRAAIKQGYR